MVVAVVAVVAGCGAAGVTAGRSAAIGASVSMAAARSVPLSASRKPRDTGITITKVSTAVPSASARRPVTAGDHDARRTGTSTNRYDAAVMARVRPTATTAPGQEVRFQPCCRRSTNTGQCTR